MAKLTRWALFWRAFFLTAIFGSGANAADDAENRVWEDAVAANSAEAYYLYLSLYPAGEYVEAALGALTELGAMDTRGLDTGTINRLRNANTPGGGLYQ